MRARDATYVVFLSVVAGFCFGLAIKWHEVALLVVGILATMLWMFVAWVSLKAVTKRDDLENRKQQVAE